MNPEDKLKRLLVPCPNCGAATGVASSMSCGKCVEILFSGYEAKLWPSAIIRCKCQSGNGEEKWLDR